MGIREAKKNTDPDPQYRYCFKLKNPHPPLHPASVSSPRTKRGGGVHTRRAVRGVGGQYFGRRQP
jgi:hypothetical protein